MRLRIASIIAAAADRPEGYVEDVLAAGRIDGEWLEIEAADMDSLRCKYREPKSYPSVARMALNIAQSAAQEALAIASMKNPASAENVAERLAICAACAFYEDGRCRQCGCFMAIKARMRTAVCPVGRWNPLDVPSSSG